MRTNYNITREYEDEGIIIYHRQGSLKQRGLMNKYFEFDKKLEQSTGNEFKTHSQVVSYLKKAHRI